MKWKYDKKYKIWWAENGLKIERYKIIRGYEYSLSMGYRHIWDFKKLSTAKQVAELIVTG